MLSRRALAPVTVAVGIAASVAVTAAGARGAQVPRTLLTTRSPIRAFAQDGGRIAWIGRTWAVRLDTLRTGKTVLAGSARPFGREAKDAVQPHVALAGTRVLWTQSGGGDSLETDIYAFKPGERKARVVGGSQADRYVGVGDGDYFGDLAGDAQNLVFSILFYRCADSGCTQLSVPTNFEAHFDGTFRVDGATRASRLSGARGAFELAVAGRRVAILPSANPIPPDAWPFAAPGTTVDVRDTASGSVIAQFTPPGTVRALALSGTVAAVVDEAGDGTRTIERYDARTGALLGVATIAAGNALGLSGHTLVYAVGRTIESMDATTGATAVLATSPATPVGLSVSGKRVAWAVNARGRGRILALTLP